MKNTNTITKRKVVKVRTAPRVSLWEICGYVAIALTVIGQILIGSVYLAGQGCWLVANALYLVKAIKQNSGKAEIVRNVLMSALTIGLMIYWVI